MIGLFGGYAYSAGKLGLLEDFWRSLHFDSSVDLMLNIWLRHFLKETISALVKEDDVLNVPLYAPIVYLPFLHMDYCKLYGRYTKKWTPFIAGAVSYPFLTVDNIPVFPLNRAGVRARNICSQTSP